MMPGTLPKPRIGITPMKTSNTEIAVALTIALATLSLAGCGKSEPTPTATAQAAAKTGAAADKPAEKGDEKHGHGEHKEGEAGHGDADQLKLTAEAIEAAGIKTEEIAEAEIVDQLIVTATIRPNQDRITHVSPRVSGRIVTVQAKLGDPVKAGQTLAVLDSLEVGEAHSAYLQARTQHTVAKADFERAEKLHGDQIIAQKDHLRAHAEYEKAKASVAAAGDKLRMLGVNTAPADDGRAMSTFPLSTPFAGTVIEKHAILGELAQPDKSIFTVADLSCLWIEANLFEKDLGRVRAGRGCRSHRRCLPRRSLPGQAYLHRGGRRQGEPYRAGPRRGLPIRAAGSNPRCSLPPPSALAAPTVAPPRRCCCRRRRWC
jgi:cobalt-zinc-cadmium efflux system membrane fusion protein